MECRVSSPVLRHGISDDSEAAVVASSQRARRIMAVTYGGGHVAMMIPVLRELQAEGHHVDVVGLTTARLPLERAGFVPLGFRHVLTARDRAAADCGRRLVERLPASDKVSIEESVAYLGLSYVDLEEQHGAVEAARRFAERGRQAFVPLGPMRRLIECVRPDVVVTSNSPRGEIAAIMAAEERSISTVRIVDLFGTGWSDAVPARRVCASNTACMQNLESQGLSRDQLVMTGNPALDRLVHSSERELAGVEWRRSLGIRDSMPLILLAMQPYVPGFEPERLVECVRSCGQKTKEFRVAVRPHPSQTRAEAEGVVNQLDGCGLLAADPSLDVLLYACDSVLTCFSTVALEGAILGRQILLVGPNSETHKLPLHRYGWAEFVSLPEKAPDLLLRPRSTPAECAVRSQSVRQAWMCDGQAARRVAAIVASL